MMEAKVRWIFGPVYFRSKFPGDILDVNSPEVVLVSYLISLAFFKCNSPTDCAARLETAQETLSSSPQQNGKCKSCARANALDRTHHRAQLT